MESLNRIFQSASSVQSEDPEQALFLYQRVLEIDPSFMGGTIRDFVERQEHKLKPVRLEKLRERIDLAKQQGHWIEVKQLAESMQKIDPDNEDASEQIGIAEQNAQCEPIYEQAKIASKTEDTSTVKILMLDINETCSDYGDPLGLLSNVPITREVVGLIRDTCTLEGHIGLINSIAFSNDVQMIATASADRTIKIWSVDSGKLIIELKQNTQAINAVTFSLDDKYLISVSDDGFIHLWKVASWELIQSVEAEGKVNTLAISPNGKQLITGDEHGILRVHDLPQISSNNSLDANHSITTVDYSYDGSWVACGIRDVEFGDDEDEIEYEYGHIQLLDTNTWKVAPFTQIESDEHKGRISHVRFSHDSKFFASLAEDKYNIRSLPSGSLIKTDSNSIYGQTTDFCFSPADKSLLIMANHNSYRNENSLIYFDLETISKLHTHH